MPARIRTLDAYSAHVDAEGFLRWAKARAPITGSKGLRDDKLAREIIAERARGGMENSASALRRIKTGAAPREWNNKEE